MSRRCGQTGTIVIAGGWYRVRFRLDVPGQERREQKSVRICPKSGPGLLTKSERERRKLEIVNSFGANSKQRFESIQAIESSPTFREQSARWLNACKTRKRKPIKPATLRGWESYLKRHLNPLIGDMLLPNITNGTLKMLGEKLSEAHLSPSTIRDILMVMRAVKSSCVDGEGNQIFPTIWNFEFADIPLVKSQRTPMFTGEEVTKIVEKAERQERMIYILAAASALRIGELLALEVRHFVGDTITVEQSAWEGRVQTPKTPSAYRQVELHPSVASLLQEFVGERKDGFIFRSCRGTCLRQSNLLRGSLHRILDDLGIEKQGFHGFRRFRVTHLESSYVPSALLKYWTGHAKSGDGSVVQQTVTDRYIKMERNTKFRADVAERIGLGFGLPSTNKESVIAPSVPSSEEIAFVVSV